MPDFSKYFDESEGKPVDYQGRTLFLGDEFPVSQDMRQVLVSREKTSSEWKQGVFLKIDRGRMLVNDKSVGKCTVLWEDTAPREVVIELKGNPQRLFVHNVWDPGSGAMLYGTFGAAMFMEEIDQGRRYFCNDGHPDDDFDDIVFTLKQFKCT